LSPGNCIMPIDINTTGISPGIYLVRLYTGSSSYQKPVFLSR
jgi:hypothetical protein